MQQMASALPLTLNAFFSCVPLSSLPSTPPPSPPTKMSDAVHANVVVVAAALFVHSDTATSTHAAQVLGRLLFLNSEPTTPAEALQQHRAALGRGLVQDMALRQLEVIAKTDLFRALQLWYAREEASKS